MFEQAWHVPTDSADHFIRHLQEQTRDRDTLQDILDRVTPLMFAYHVNHKSFERLTEQGDDKFLRTLSDIRYHIDLLFQSQVSIDNEAVRQYVRSELSLCEELVYYAANANIVAEKISFTCVGNPSDDAHEPGKLCVVLLVWNESRTFWIDPAACTHRNSWRWAHFVRTPRWRYCNGYFSIMDNNDIDFTHLRVILAMTETICDSEWLSETARDIPDFEKCRIYISGQEYKLSSLNRIKRTECQTVSVLKCCDPEPQEMHVARFPCRNKSSGTWMFYDDADRQFHLYEEDDLLFLELDAAYYYHSANRGNPSALSMADHYYLPRLSHLRKCAHFLRFGVDASGSLVMDQLQPQSSACVSVIRCDVK